MADDEQTDADFTPPYNVPWATFIGTVERVAAELPNRVDRFYLSNQSGTTQTYLISALKGFGLIRHDLTVSKDVWQPLSDEATRKSAVAELFRTHYLKAVELGATNATDGELNDAFAAMFPSVTGQSRVKAIRFFLFGMAYGDMPRSPLWKTAKVSAGQGAGRKSRPRKTIPPPASSIAGTSPDVDSVSMKQAYFDLLIKKAESSQDAVDTGLLDRIERLIGLNGAPPPKD